MSFRSRLLVCISIFWGSFAFAQVVDAQKEIEAIDSLFVHHQYAEARERTDKLSRELDQSKDGTKYKSILLELKYRRARALDRLEQPPSVWLPILLELIEETEAAQLPQLSYKAYLLIALAYEKSDQFHLTQKYLELALRKLRKHRLEHLYSTYCIRKSSFHRFKGEMDSMKLYASTAKEYAERYDNTTDLMDSYLLLGILASKTKNYRDALKYNSLLLNYHKKLANCHNIFVTYANIGYTYLWMGDFRKALIYNDSSSTTECAQDHPTQYHRLRYLAYEGLGNIDSAYFHLNKYHVGKEGEREEEERTAAKQLEEQYQNAKKEATIKAKNQQLVFINILLAVIVIGTILIMRRNRKINQQNKIINRQVGELTKALEQKDVLLTELQHRVKNNLQHVISILEIQKESVDFNNIDELIRGNQNRIHSMALLHKKLNVTESVNEVNLMRYVSELAEIVKDSYDNHTKTISLNIKCDVEKMSIEKAMPIGLILTELVSNSMKHAFQNRSVGIINIEITDHYRLYYSDNGEGYDFNETSDKGLGQQIIKGLIGQLDATVVYKNDNGFELSIYFK